MKPCIAVGLIGALAALPAFGQNQHTPEDVAFFEQRVRPLLVEHCYECHAHESKNLRGGLYVDTPQMMLTGGDSGPAIVPHQVDDSLLIQAVRYDASTSPMPPKGKLPEHDIETLKDWIRRGAPMPSVQEMERVRPKVDLVQGRQHWAFQPLRSYQPRVQQASDWPQTKIDSFVLDKLLEAGLAPNVPASKHALMRRAKFDLLGLPPTPEELDAFERDDSPDAFTRQVDAWLDSPQHGERWARHWLELARYCDIMEDWAETLGNTYLYRDWVVRAMNADVPYDRFVTMQIAADQMDDAQPSDVAALGFIGISPSYWKELQLPVDIIRTIVSDEIEEKVHTVSSTFLGLNIACARCHDHKFDPITSADYYALAGVLANSKPCDRAIVPHVDSDKVYEARKLVKKLDAELQPLLANKTPENQAKIDELQAKIQQAKATPGYDAPLAPAVTDARLVVANADGTHGSKLVYESQLQDIAIEIRGNPNKLGETVPRRFVSVLSRDESARFGRGSGRLELAQSLTQDAAPLLPRVMVNRIWKLHFGVGIVATPSDFGRQGELPSHPELLDDLAYRFVEHGWSIKWLHREIVLSATYQQASGPATNEDPEARLYSRFPRKRLDVESWRDAMLFAAGKLDLQVGGPALELNSSSNSRRTLYGLVRRRELNDLLRLFDFPDPLTHSPSRIPTTTPLQQLFALNSPLLMEQSAHLADRLAREAASDLRARVQAAYQLLFQRPPDEQELALAINFLGEGSSQAWSEYLQVLLTSNEFYFID